VDVEAGPLVASVQALTRKIAIFVRPRLVLTIHRVPMPLLAEVEHRFPGASEDRGVIALLGVLLNAALDSYGPPLERAEETLDRLEEALFTARRQPPPIIDLYVLKRRVTIMSRLIRQTTIVIQRMVPPTERSATPVVHDLRENAESYQFYAENLLESINNLLAIHVSLASQRTNDVMRILTVFSAFFLPLTFIVGVYGMNFRHMPELEIWWAYPLLLVMMATVSALIAWWFRRRGWLGGS
jgi:magnesium transporter